LEVGLRIRAKNLRLLIKPFSVLGAGMIMVLFMSTTSYAFDLQLFAGQQTILNNTLFSSDNGTGSEYSGRLHYSPGDQDFFSIGLNYSQSEYSLVSKSEPEGVNFSGTGTFKGESYGSHITVTAPIPLFTVYLGFGYNFANYTYSMKKISSQDNSDGQLIESELRSIVSLKSTGLRSAIGLKTMGRFNGLIEISDSFQTLEISKVQVRSLNKIDGEYETRDGLEDSVNESYQNLVGGKFNFSTRTILIGFEFYL